MLYHCSPITGLKILNPSQPKYKKTQGVYMTTVRCAALLYGIKNFEYTYGYTPDGVFYYDEYYPGALKKLYKGKNASLYICAPQNTFESNIPNERISSAPVKIIEEIFIPDLYDAILNLERKGQATINRFESQSEKKLLWIRNTMTEILQTETDTSYIDYIKKNYF